MRLNNLTFDDVKLILIGLQEMASLQRDIGDAEGIEFADEVDELIDRLLQQVSDNNLTADHYKRKHQQAAA
jgi:hypothetical protein